MEQVFEPASASQKGWVIGISKKNNVPMDAASLGKLSKADASVIISEDLARKQGVATVTNGNAPKKVNGVRVGLASKMALNDWLNSKWQPLGKTTEFKADIKAYYRLLQEVEQEIGSAL